MLRTKLLIRERGRNGHMLTTDSVTLRQLLTLLYCEIEQRPARQAHNL